MWRSEREKELGFGVPAVGVFLVALATRAFHVSQLRGSALFDVYLGDAAGYHAWAQRLALGDWLGSEVFYQAPLYPYSLAVVYSILGELWAPRIVQALLGALACSLLALAGQRLFSARAGLIAGLALAVYPTAIFFDGLIQKSVLDNLLLCLLLWLLSRSMARPQPGPVGLWTGMTLAALMLSRENALVFLPPIVLWLALDARLARRQRMTAVAWLLGGMALLLAPVAVRNHAMGGGFHLTTSQFGPNFYIGNHAGASGVYQPLRYGRGGVDYERLDATNLAQEATGRTLSPGEVSNYWRGRAFEFIREQPGAWLRLMGRKIALVWNAAEVEDTEDQTTYARSSLVLRPALVFHFGVVAPLGFLGIWLTRHRWRELWLLYGMIAVYSSSVALFFVLGRYRYPLVPLLLLFAGAGLAQITSVVRSATRAELATAAAVLVGTVMLTNLPIYDVSRSVVTTEVNLGKAFLKQGELARAAEHLERAIELQSDNPLAHYNLGNVLHLQGRNGEAIPHYRRAIELAPDDVESHNNLGLALAATGNADAALAHYRRAVQLDPRHPEAHNNLANARARQGRIDEALALYDEAIAARPAYVDAYVNKSTVLDVAGRSAEALEVLVEAAALVPGEAEILRLQSGLEVRLGHPEQAAVHLEDAARLEPGDARIRFELGRVLATIGRSAEAIVHLRTAARLQPAVGHFNALAWVLATRVGASIAEVDEALTNAERAASMTGNRDPAVLAVLAAARAASGDYSGAVATAQRALALATEVGATQLISNLTQQLALYGRGLPYRVGRS
ncbi:MAG: tetratricopeptide repeat protein [Acidobacteria bacterium]|nr:tetratricopeptide repeat protein [Acidobacteriota bacterium]